MGKKAGGVRIKQVGGGKAPSKAALASMMGAGGPPKLEDFMVPPEEQISLPLPMNKKYQMFYPIHETFTMQTDTFQMIYPSYIDPTKTIQQGRRVPLHLLVTRPNNTNVISNITTDTDDMMIVESYTIEADTGTEENEIIILSPTIQEVSQVLQSLQIRHVIQPYRCYSRCDPWENPGRCLVDIKSNHYKNKYELLVVVAKGIQELSSRSQRMELERIRQVELRQQKLQAQQLALTTEQQTLSTTTSSNAATSSGTVTTSTATASTNKKKSNKKKK